MAWVTDEFIDTWESGEQIGAATPHSIVEVQNGKWSRGYNPWDGPALRANIYGEPAGAEFVGSTGGFWQARWHALGSWTEVPNLLSVQRTQDLMQNGITVATIILDAVDFVDAVGALGDAYHVIAPGFLAAYRNFVPTSRPDPRWSTSELEGVLVDGVKIRVWQGFGEPQRNLDGSMPLDGGTNGAWTFVGQIDDVDTDAGDSTQGSPNQIVITARAGKLLTDQTLFGWTKSPQLPDPIIFYDDLSADVLSLVGYRALAIDHEADFPPANALDLPVNPWSASDPAYSTEWRGPAGSAGDIQWLQVRLKQGRYEDCWIVVDPSHAMGCYIGVKANAIVYRSDSTTYSGGVSPEPTEQVLPPRMDGIDQAVGWLPGPTVPGQDWTYIRFIPLLNGDHGSGPTLFNIGQFFHTLEVGDGSILRVGFTNLPNVDGANRAVVKDLHGRRRRLSTDAARSRWITVPDASDVIRVVLRWCGYHDWVVEEAGVRLNGRLVFNRAQTPMEIITTLTQQTGFVFFIADPVDGESEGIPTFRRDSSLLADNNYIAADLRDDGNLVGIKRKGTDENRLFIVRVRGTSAPPSKDIPGRGVRLQYGGGFVGLGGDTIKRIMATYLPPWAVRPVPGIFTEACAGVLRRIIYHDDNLQSYAQCYMGCLLIALRSALAIHSVQVSIPAHPIVEVDDQVSVLDEPSGTNSRMWVTKRDDTMTLGDQQSSAGSGGSGSWTQTLEGALMDTPEFQSVIEDALAVDWKALAAHTGSDPNQPPLPGLVVTGTSRPARRRT